ncbi:MAG: hypothetical protein WC099_00570 [Candidatus Paceibacterota bacterium]
MDTGLLNILQLAMALLSMVSNNTNISDTMRQQAIQMANNAIQMARLSEKQDVTKSKQEIPLSQEKTAKENVKFTFNWSPNKYPSNSIGYIELTNTGNSSAIYIIDNIPNTGSLLWNPDNPESGFPLPTGTYVAKIVMSGKSDIIGEWPTTFIHSSKHTEQPIIICNDLKNGKKWQSGEPQTIWWSTNDIPSGASGYIQLDKQNTNGRDYLIRITNSGSYTFSKNEIAIGSYTARIVIGNIGVIAGLLEVTKPVPSSGNNYNAENSVPIVTRLRIIPRD